MQIGFIVNEEKDKNFEYTKKLIDFVISKNKIPLLLSNLKKYFNTDEIKFYEEGEFFKNADFIVILGGDGTILRWSFKISKYNKNILGINMGYLGYLAEVEKQDGFDAIDKVINGQYTIEKRMRIEASVCGETYVALNEFSISSRCIGRMIKMGIDINDKPVDVFSADGVIISTPTGSTAYNLSAGGPILKPDLELIAITYICPHAIFSRPYVVSSEDTIKTYLIGDDTEGVLSIDGQHRVCLKAGEVVEIKRANIYTNIIKTSNLNFYDILRKKMFNIRM